MWGIVIGVVGIGLTLYEIWFRDDTKALPAGNPNARMALPPAVARQRATACGLMAGDERDADRWSGNLLGYNLPLTTRLALMRSAVAWAQWPPSARRVYCTYVGEIPLENAIAIQAARPNQAGWH